MILIIFLVLILCFLSSLVSILCFTSLSNDFDIQVLKNMKITGKQEEFSFISFSKKSSSSTKTKNKSKKTKNKSTRSDTVANTIDTDDSDFELIEERSVFPQLKPQICVCVLSHKRLHLLRKTLRAAIRHFEQDEPDVAYEIVWVDNGSSKRDVHRLHSQFQIEKAVSLGDNYNLAYGFNTLFFRMCSAPYILTLEEDWAYAPKPSGAARGMHATYWRQHIIRASMMLLQTDTTLSGVVVRGESYDQYCNVGEWQALAPPDDTEEPIEYRKYCMHLASGYPWGAYTNGPAVYDRQRLLTVGTQYGEPENDAGFPAAFSEANYAVRIGLKYPCSAMIRTLNECETISCNGVFDHIGNEQSMAAPELRKQMQAGDSIEWVLYDTPLAEQLKSME